MYFGPIMCQLNGFEHLTNFANYGQTEKKHVVKILKMEFIYSDFIEVNN